MIPDALENLSGGINALFLNAIYFEGKWTYKFDKNRTKESPFAKEDGTHKTVNLMYQRHDFRYNESEAFSTAILPYGNGAFNMVIALPNAGFTVKSILEEMDSKLWDEILNSAQVKQLDLYIPKFHIDYYNNGLIPVLDLLGIKSIFQKSADLSLIADGFNNCITQLNQNIILDIDEEGTKAKIKTTAVSGLTMNVPDTIVFKADHPFVFFIVEKSTGIVLLEGIYS